VVKIKKKSLHREKYYSETQAEQKSNIPESEHYQYNTGIFDL